MITDKRREGHEALDQIPEHLLAEVVQWLKRVATAQDNPNLKLTEVLPGVVAETEAQWEERVLAETLGSALTADGSIDYNQLELINVPWDELETPV